MSAIEITQRQVPLSDTAAKLVYRDRSGRPYSPEQITLVTAICEQLGCVPWLRHVVLLGDAAYITLAGLLHVAQQTGELDGIETRPATSTERASFGLPEGSIVWRADVWRRGSAHPYVGWGRALGGEQGAAKTHPYEMAATRATARALRLAFGVGMTSAEEMSEEHIPSVIGEQTGEITAPPASKPISSPPTQPPSMVIGAERAVALGGLLEDILRTVGWDRAQATAWVQDGIRALGVPDPAHLTEAQGKGLLKRAEALLPRGNGRE